MSVELFVVPVSSMLLVNVFYPYIFKLRSDDYMFSLPLPFIMGMYIASFFLFGYSIYLGDKIGNKDIYITATLLSITNILWGIYYDINSNMTVILLFSSLLLGYIVYNEIFLSELTENGTTLYLNLYSAYIIFMGFMIAVSIEKFRDNGKYKHDDLIFKKEKHMS
jgi:hypothetical protein